MPHVVLDKVGKVFKAPDGRSIHALASLNLTVEPGECLSLVGPSGSGKTTVLRLVSGLDTPTSGSVLVDPHPVNGAAQTDGRPAMVFQQPALYPHMTVAENLGFGLKLRRWSRKDSNVRIQEVAELLGLSDVLNRLPESLSGGQRQRVAIGRALARRAPLLLLDEPLANIDPTLRNQMRSELADLRKRHQTTMIYVTHDHIEAMLVGDRVAVLHQGVLQQVGPSVKVYRAPANLFVATFIGFPSVNLFPGTICSRNNELWFEAAQPNGINCPTQPAWSARLTGITQPRLSSCVGQRLVLGFRPEAAQLSEKSGYGTGSLSFQGSIVLVEHAGPDKYVKVACSGVCLVARVDPQVPLKIGDGCKLLVPLEDCFWFDERTGQALAFSCAS